MTSKLIVNSLAADTGVSTITFADQAKMGNAIFHSTGFTIGDSFLHSTGVNITNINATGVITATKFVGEVSVGSSITFEDNEKAYFGTGTDFSIYHNGSASYLDETGTGGLIAKTNTAFQVFNSAGSQAALTVTPGGSVDLYHNTTKVLETKAYGIDITGGFVATGDCSIADKITHAGDLNTAIRFPAADTFSVETAGSERLRIHDDGEVEIKAAANGQTVLSCTAAYASSSTVDIQTWARSDGAVKAAMKYSHGTNSMNFGTTTNHPLIFQVNNTEKIRITSDGVVQVPDKIKLNTNGSYVKENQLLFQPSGTAFIDHGVTGQDIQFRTSVNSALDTSSVKVTSAGNVAFMPGRGLDFSAASSLISGRGTSTSHILDDYEEGDYTPTFTVQSGSVTLDSNQKTLIYTKIGRQVTIIGSIKIASVNNPSGIFRATLPFTRANNTEQSERTMGNLMVTGAAVNNANEFTTYPDGGVDSHLEVCSISGTGNMVRNGGQNMQANAVIYVNYTYFTN